LFHVPRAYEPIVKAWDQRYPGVVRALERLEKHGFAAHQGPVIVDLRTGGLADREGRKVPRFKTTAAGSRLAAEVLEDPRVLEDKFQRLTSENAMAVARLLDALDLDKSHARYGISRSHAVTISGLSERTGRWWVNHLVERGYARELDEKYADVRQVVPGHWRVTRLLCRQLDDVLSGLPASDPHAALRAEFRLRRARFLSDIDIGIRLGMTGSTDFDHDVEAQRVLAALLSSPRCMPSGVFAVEPRLHLEVATNKNPWVFQTGTRDAVPYQPDAVLTERDEVGGRVVSRRNIVEYERHQTRRDAWSHIERFLGYLHTMTLPVESACLRFVVDSRPRERTYVSLIEAFADYALDHPDRMPANPTQLAVTSIPRLMESSDPLGATTWFRIVLPAPDDPATSRHPVLHLKEESPYDEYFSRDVD
jgi:hypothetical protein